MQDMWPVFLRADILHHLLAQAPRRPAPDLHAPGREHVCPPDGSGFRLQSRDRQPPHRPARPSLHVAAHADLAADPTPGSGGLRRLRELRIQPVPPDPPSRGGRGRHWFLVLPHRQRAAAQGADDPAAEASAGGAGTGVRPAGPAGDSQGRPPSTRGDPGSRGGPGVTVQRRSPELSARDPGHRDGCPPPGDVVEGAADGEESAVPGERAGPVDPSQSGEPQAGDDRVQQAPAGQCGASGDPFGVAQLREVAPGAAAGADAGDEEGAAGPAADGGRDPGSAAVPGPDRAAAAVVGVLRAEDRDTGTAGEPPTRAEVRVLRAETSGASRWARPAGKCTISEAQCSDYRDRSPVPILGPAALPFAHDPRTRMTALLRKTLRGRLPAGAGAMVLALSACASTSTTDVPRTPTAPSQATLDVPDPVLPEDVAIALLVGSALLESGDARSALEYYRRAHRLLPEDPELARRYVDVALRAGRAEAALTTLEDLVDRFPEDAGLARQRAQLLAMTGRTEQALTAAEELVERFPGDDFGAELRVELLQQAGRPQEALAAVDAMIEREPEVAAWRIRRGDVLLELERPEETEAAWRRALELEPDSVEAIDRLSELLRLQGRDEELLTMLQDLVDRDALGPTQQARLADLYLARGDRERTVELLLPMARRGVLEPRARMIVADLLASLDRREEAIAVLEPLVENPEVDPARVRRTIGELYMELDDYERAVEELRRAAEAAPEDGGAHVSLLLAMSQADPGLLSGRADEREIAAFERWLDRTADAVSGDSVRQNYLLGALLRRAGSTERAQPWLQRAAELDQENFQVLYDLAVVQESNRDFEGARATLERLLELEPDDAHLKNFYGYLLADQGWELERAERLIREAVAEEPDNGAYVDSLGWVLYRQGHYEEALDRLIKAVNLLGDDPVVLEHVGECLAALGRHEEALRSFERARVAGGDTERLEERIEAMREAMREQP